jgi:hypothetical protein
VSTWSPGCPREIIRLCCTYIIICKPAVVWNGKVCILSLDIIESHVAHEITVKDNLARSVKRFVNRKVKGKPFSNYQMDHDLRSPNVMIHRKFNRCCC